MIQLCFDMAKFKRDFSFYKYCSNNKREYDKRENVNYICFLEEINTLNMSFYHYNFEIHRKKKPSVQVIHVNMFLNQM